MHPLLLLTLGLLPGLARAESLVGLLGVDLESQQEVRLFYPVDTFYAGFIGSPHGEDEGRLLITELFGYCRETGRLIRHEADAVEGLIARHVRVENPLDHLLSFTHSFDDDMTIYAVREEVRDSVHLITSHGNGLENHLEVDLSVHLDGGMFLGLSFSTRIVYHAQDKSMAFSLILPETGDRDISHSLLVVSSGGELLHHFQSSSNPIYWAGEWYVSEGGELIALRYVEEGLVERRLIRPEPLELDFIPVILPSPGQVLLLPTGFSLQRADCAEKELPEQDEGEFAAHPSCVSGSIHYKVLDGVSIERLRAGIVAELHPSPEISKAQSEPFPGMDGELPDEFLAELETYFPIEASIWKVDPQSGNCLMRISSIYYHFNLFEATEDPGITARRLSKEFPSLPVNFTGHLVEGWIPESLPPSFHEEESGE